MSKAAFLLATSLPELVTGTEQGQESAGRMGPLGSISRPLAQKAGKCCTGLSTSKNALTAEVPSEDSPLDSQQDIKCRQGKQEH